MPREQGFRIVKRPGGTPGRTAWDVYGPDGYAWLEIVAGLETNLKQEWHPAIAIYDADGNQVLYKEGR